jgi:hypothetical protein
MAFERAPVVRTACICTYMDWVSSGAQLLLHCELQLYWLLWGCVPPSPRTPWLCLLSALSPRCQQPLHKGVAA